MNLDVTFWAFADYLSSQIHKVHGNQSVNFLQAGIVHHPGCKTKCDVDLLSKQVSTPIRSNTNSAFLSLNLTSWEDFLQIPLSTIIGSSAVKHVHH